MKPRLPRKKKKAWKKLMAETTTMFKRHRDKEIGEYLQREEEKILPKVTTYPNTYKYKDAHGKECLGYLTHEDWLNFKNKMTEPDVVQVKARQSGTGWTMEYLRELLESIDVHKVGVPDDILPGEGLLNYDARKHLEMERIFDGRALNLANINLLLYGDPDPDFPNLSAEQRKRLAEWCRPILRPGARAGRIFFTGTGGEI